MLSSPPKVKRSPLISNILRPTSLSGNFGPYVSKMKRDENDDLLLEVLCSPGGGDCKGPSINYVSYLGGRGGSSLVTVVKNALK